MTPEAILADLVACADLPGQDNARVAACVRGHLGRMGVETAVLPGPEGDRVNLLATIGPRDVPGVVLSGHMDVVPVAGQDWASDPFRLTERDGRLYGRGTADMKGFLACMLAMVPAFRAAGLARPVHLAFSYDEEIGCRGVPHLIAALPGLCAPPLACIVGEPTEMRPVLSHKGKQAMRLAFQGRAAHSSDPGAGVNANYAGAALMLGIRDLNAGLSAQGPFDARFAPAHSTVVAGVVRGGTTVNIIPDLCEVDFEVRSIPGQDAAQVAAEVLALADGLVAQGMALSVRHKDLSAYPALPPAADPALAQWLERLTGRPALQSVSYGTEAGLFQRAGIPAIICGPGAIMRAHRPDEYITAAELAECCAMLQALAGSAEMR
ncbi:acetylornithine deacetylase [Paracoccus yeei]|uniref:acetylornithine deacetylase n=1 Tax=Paracoccus yeei TaxID=147645 RepID=UPI002430675E|nr:acetylornithine deacetylase [Paracoccus yeei]